MTSGSKHSLDLAPLPWCNAWHKTSLWLETKFTFCDCAEYLQSMCSDCVDDAGDTPREDEDEEAVSAIAEVPAAIDDPWDRAADGERFPWRLWSIRDTTWVTSVPTESVFFQNFPGFLFSQGHNKYFLQSNGRIPIWNNYIPLLPLDRCRTGNSTSISILNCNFKSTKHNWLMNRYLKFKLQMK